MLQNSQNQSYLMSCCYICPGCFCLNDEEQYLLNGLTTKKVVNGPTTDCVLCCWKGEKRAPIRLTADQYIKIKNGISGDINMIRGPALHFLGAFDSVVPNNQVSTAINLDATEFLIVTNLDGKVWQEVGPKAFFPGPFDTPSPKYRCVALEHNDFVKILDRNSGQMRVERGEGRVFLEPFEEFILTENEEIVRKAVNIDEHTACLIRNTQNGQLVQINKKMLFFPTIHEEIIEIQEKVVLKDHETAIIKDKDGNFHFISGATGPHPSKSAMEAIFGMIQPKQKKKSKKSKKDTNQEDDLDTVIQTYYRDVFGMEKGGRAFFVPPYCEMVSLSWTLSNKKSENVSKIDGRPHFLEYTLECRTTDNVELIIDVTFFIQVINVEKMIEKTDDAPGDICAHARSVAIQAVSVITMEDFMLRFNSILSRAILETDDPFYDERGCVIHSVEVKSYHCKDQGTEEVLQEIIKERTDRMNRLQKQESENEVRLFKMKGDMEEERLHGDLLKIRHSHHRAEAAMEGEAEADQLRMFLDGLEDVDDNIKFEFWSTLRKLDAIRAVSNNGGSFYYTPTDVDLSIGKFGNPYTSIKKNK